jgi:hypothetical protein
VAAVPSGYTKMLIGKLLRWLMFGVSFSVLPIICAYLNLMLKGSAPNITSVIGDGGLFLVLAGLCAGAVGELIGSARTHSNIKIISGGFAILTLVLSSFLFAAIAEDRELSTSTATVLASSNAAAIASTSIWIFLIGLLPCSACIAISGL